MDTGAKQEESAVPLADGVAVLECTTGPFRGKTAVLKGAALDVVLSDEDLFHITEASPGDLSEGLIARLHRAGNTYELEASPERPVWVNGVRATQRMLEIGDMIEFGETGPLARFRVYGPGERLHKTTSEILGDCFAYVRSSRQPPVRKAYRVV